MRFLAWFLVCFVAGCAGVEHCVELGGEYEGVDGTVKYCWHKDKSDDLGHPVLESENGERIVGISEHEANELASLLEADKASMSESESTEPEEDGITRLCRLLRARAQ